MLQAAHQSAAHAGNLRGVQGQILLLGHLDGHRYEIRQMGMTAQWSSTDTDAAQNLCLIPDADLPQLDTGTEHAGQILYQLAEIDASVRGKIKQYLVIIKGILCLDQLHFQSVLFNLFLADLKRLFFLEAVGRLPGIVLLGRDPDHRLQGLNNLLILHLFGTHYHISVFHASGGLHDHMLSLGDIQLSGGKEIYFSRIPESDAYDFFHFNSPLSSA